MPKESMTRKQVEDLIEVTALKFTAIMTEKLDEFSEKQKVEQRLSREATFEQCTGYTWDQRGVFKSVINWASAAKKNSNSWRNAGVIAIIGLAIKTFWSDIKGG